MKDDSADSAEAWAQAILDSIPLGTAHDVSINLDEELLVDVILLLRRLGCEVAPATRPRLFTIERRS